MDVCFWLLYLQINPTLEVWPESLHGEVCLAGVQRGVRWVPPSVVSLNKITTILSRKEIARFGRQRYHARAGPGRPGLLGG